MNPDLQNNALPLDELQLTPEWLKAPARSFEHHSGADREQRSGDRRSRPRDREGTSDRKPRRFDDARPRPPKDGGRRREERRGPPPALRRPELPRPVSAPLSPVNVEFLPEEKGFAAMVAAMKATTRAYRLFDLAKLVLNKPERHLVKLTRKPAGAGESHPMLFLVLPSETPCLSQAEAVRCVMRRHADQVYKVAKKPVEPPKGNFQFVNRCGITGEILGPPNFHEYQSRLIRYHKQRLAHVPFDEFRSRLQTVRDPEVVKAWIESMSFTTEYQCVLCPDPKMFASRDELEKHFVEQHLAALITSAPELTVAGTASRQLAPGPILDAIRVEWESECRFPLKTANALRPRLAQEGFHFFKRPKGISYVTHIRPKRFESLEHLAPHIQTIIAFLRGQEGCTRQQLLAYLSAATAVSTQPSPVPEAAAVPATTSGAAPAEPPAAVVTPAAPLAAPSNEHLLVDLHWLISEGYAVEFSDGRLWAPREKVPVAQAPPASTAPAVVASEGAPNAAAVASSASSETPAPEPAASAREAIAPPPIADAI